MPQVPRFRVHSRKDFAQGPVIFEYSEQQHEQVLEPVELLDIAFPANAAGLPQNFAFREVFCDLCVYRLSGKISTFHSAFEFVLCAKETIVKSGGSRKRKSPFFVRFLVELKSFTGH